MHGQVQNHNPNLVLLTETKCHRSVQLAQDLACDSRDYRAIDIISTENYRGGLVLILRRDIRLETVKIVTKRDGDNFMLGLVLEDRTGKSLVFWYCAPTCENGAVGEMERKLLTDYEVQVFAGDFNTRHPHWCKRHDAKKGGALIHEIVRNKEGYGIHTPDTPTFQAITNRGSGTYDSSTIKLVVAKTPIDEIKCLTGEITMGSDHYPVRFKINIQVDRGDTSRRIPKTPSQSSNHREVIVLTYEVSLKKVNGILDGINERTMEEATKERVQEVYKLVQDTM